MPGNLPITTTPVQQGISYGACGAGCTCLTDAEAQAQFGSGYVKCSETACGPNQYCFRAQDFAGQLSGQKVQPKPLTGSLAVSSSPPGASVTVDGQYSGKTPVNISGLTPGAHTVRFSLAGYQESTQTPSVMAGSTTPLSVTLVPSSQGVSPNGTVTPGGTTPVSGAAGGVQLSDERVKMDAEGFNKLNPQPEPPHPDDLNKLNPQPEPPKPPSSGFFDVLFGMFAGLFGGNKQGITSAPNQGSGETAPSMQVMSGGGCLGVDVKDCNGQCVNVQSDPKNCGDCSITCPGLKVCSLGTCKNTCDAGLTECNDGSCVNLQEDRNNCGACGKKCDPTTQCSDGNCVVGSLSNSYRIEGVEELVARAAKESKGSSINQYQIENPVIKTVNEYNTIAIDLPKEGDTYYYGQTIVISWGSLFEGQDFGGHRNFNIELIRDTGEVLYKVQVSEHRYQWDLSLPSWRQVEPDQLSGTSQAYIRISTPDQRFSGTSGWFTITDNPFSPKAQNIGTSGLKQAASNIHGEIRIISPPYNHQFTQGDRIPITWEYSNIKSYDTVKIELFRADGTFVMNVGDLYLESETGLHPNTGPHHSQYDWRTVPYQGGTGAWPCPGCKILYDNAYKGWGEFYIQISTPDGWFIGRSLPFFIDPKGLPPANIPSKE